MLALATRLRSFADRRPTVVAVGVVVVSSLVLLVRLTTPERITFDEVYYVEDALGYLDNGVEPSFAVHPTVGKWLIAAGIAVLGDGPLGWRITAALAGVVTVLLTHLLARRLLAGTRWGPFLAVVAPLLLLTDGLFVVQSRIAMLDAFLVTFTVASIWLLVVDHDRRRAGLVHPWRPSLRWLAGITIGLAISTKWSGLLVLGAAGLLTIVWELAAATRAARGEDEQPPAAATPIGTGTEAETEAETEQGPPSPLVIDAWTQRTDDPTPARRAVAVAPGPGPVGLGRWLRVVGRRAIAVLGSLVLLPALVYALTWVPWLANYEHTWAAACEGVEPIETCIDADATIATRLDGLWRYHDAIVGFHTTLESDHNYRADPLGWVVMQRPVVYYWETCTGDRAAGVQTTDDETGELVDPEPCLVPEDRAAEILAVGNPVVWWGFLLAVPLLVGGVVRRDQRSAVVLVTWLSLWVPWLFVSRAAFIFYLAPSVPFAALGVTVALHRLDGRARLLVTHLATATGAAAAFGLAVAGQAADVLDDGWRVRLAAAAIGAALGAVLGAVRDARTDRRSPRGPTRSALAARVPPPPGDPVTSRVRVVDVDDLVPVGATSASDATMDVWVRPDRTARPSPSTPTTGDPATAADGRPTTIDGDGGGTTGETAPAPATRVPRLAALTVLTAIALWVFFAPVWYAVPMARDVVEWRWWFSSWI